MLRSGGAARPAFGSTSGPLESRLIRDHRFVQLRRSIQVDPVFLDLHQILATNDGTIYAESMRFCAVQRLDWTDVPAILTYIRMLVITSRNQSASLIVLRASV